MYYDPLGRPKIGESIFKFFVIAGIVIVFGAIAILFCGGTVSNLTGRTQRLAQSEADDYLRETGLAVSQDAKAKCVGVDSDGDGYVSCPYVTKDGVTHPLECAGSMTINTGCRPPKAMITQPYQPTRK